METMRVLLIDTSTTFKKLLEASSVATESTKFEVIVFSPRADLATMDDVSGCVDAIVFGEKVPASTVIRFSRTFRSRGIEAPIVALTRENGSRVPKKFQRAGVDDMLNVTDINSPLFSWAFMSAVRHSEVENKLREFDSLQSRLKDANQSLAAISHEINSPLSVIRLALYHLENPETTPGRRNVLFRMLSENVDKVDSQLQELRKVRRILGNGSAVSLLQSPPTHQEQKAVQSESD